MQDEARESGSPEFGVLLRRYRLAAALSQQALAERAGISSDGISNLERGYRRTPQRDTLTRLAKALALDDAQRAEFEASAARASAPRRASSGDTARLPLARTTFVGRDAELDEIATLLREHRLVTVTGTGGIGKTQTALRAAAALSDAGERRVRFAGLASVAAPRGEIAPVTAAIAAAVSAREGADDAPIEALVASLGTAQLLLILDNCEHVITQAATLVDALLEGCPGIRILATSREPLRAAGECTYRLASLSMPSPDAMHRLEARDLASYGSVALFLDRARAVDRGFTITDQNAGTVGQLCRRLGGIPLAIELAAARVDLLPVEALNERLDKRFWILSGGERIALPRQQTMHATIEWSYELLSPQEQRLFESLSVFVGGFTLDAAEEVAVETFPTAANSVDLVLSLAEKSLVAVDMAERHERYRLLELTRAFATEKLAERGDRVTLQRRHAQWAADLADRAWAIGPASPIEPWVREFEPEVENARAAFEWALSAGEFAMAARIAGGFTGIWRLNHGHAEPRRWLEATLPQLDTHAEPRLAARAWRALSTVTYGTRRIEAAQRALELNELLDNSGGTVASLYQMAVGFLETGRVEEAEAANERALHLCREQGFTESLRYATALDLRARVAARRGRVGEARQYYAEAFALLTTLGDEHEAILVSINMGELEYRAGDFQSALSFAQSAASAARASGSTPREITALTNAAACRLALNDVIGARADAREALALARAASPIEAAVAIQHLATVAALSGDAADGARLCGYVDAWYRGEGVDRGLTERKSHELLMTSLQARLDESAIEAFGAEGARFSEEQAVTEALKV